MNKWLVSRRKMLKQCRDKTWKRVSQRGENRVIQEVQRKQRSCLYSVPQFPHPQAGEWTPAQKGTAWVLCEVLQNTNQWHGPCLRAKQLHRHPGVKYSHTFKRLWTSKHTCFWTEQDRIKSCHRCVCSFLSALTLSSLCIEWVKQPCSPASAGGNGGHGFGPQELGTFPSKEVLTAL